MWCVVGWVYRGREMPIGVRLGTENAGSGSCWGSRRDTIHKEGGAGGYGPDRGCSLLCLERVSLLGREACRVTGCCGHTGPHIDCS